MRKAIAVTLFFVGSVLSASAWGNRGHQLVALIGYLHLDPDVRASVDNLIKGNPCYSEWQQQVKSVAAADQSAAIFMLAATWPDKIKLTAPMSKTPYDCQPGFKFDSKDGANGADGRFSADIPPQTPDASRNVGYSDDRRHQYWHFIDTPISGDGTAATPAAEPNVLTQVKMLIQAMGSNEAECLKSYDLVWLEHLTGDMHQPLHDAERYTSVLHDGDQGGNAVKICNSSSGKCSGNLHAYWDDLPGSDASLTATIKLGKTMSAQATPDSGTLDLDHPEKWVASATELAESDAYASPFNKSVKQVNSSDIPSTYHDKAEADMKQQIFLAGCRLAGTLNNALKDQSLKPASHCAVSSSPTQKSGRTRSTSKRKTAAS